MHNPNMMAQQQEKNPHVYRKVSLMSMPEAVLLLGGLLLIVGYFLDWTAFQYGYGVFSATGVEFGRNIGSYPETFLLPFIGIMFVAGAAFSAGRRRAYYPHKVSRGLVLAAAWIGAIVAMFISVYLTIRYSDYVRANMNGISMYNNLEIGWYLTIAGNMVLYIGCILAISVKARTIGIGDYFFVRADATVRQSDMVKPPVAWQAPMAQPMPIPSGMPPRFPAPMPPPQPAAPPRP